MALNGAETDILKSRLAEARKVLVIAGAGVSAESGVPTFRGPDGLWRQYRPEELATPEAFENDPALVWEWYDWRRGVIAGCRPNAAHEALVRMERAVPEFLLVTQNVDGLHRAAGSTRVVHLHGSLFETRCTSEGTVREDRRVPLAEIPPRCECGALLRPNVVWYGEFLPESVVRQVNGFIAEDPPDLLLVVGTTALIGYIQGWIAEAVRSGAYLVEVNPEETGITPLASLFLRGPAGTVLPAAL